MMQFWKHVVCILQSALGKDFSGYYCPIGIDVTGAAAYEKTFIASMGSPQEQPVKAHQRHRWDRGEPDRT